MERNVRWTLAALAVIASLLILLIGRDPVFGWSSSTSVTGDAVVATWNAPNYEGGNDPTETPVPTEESSGGQASETLSPKPNVEVTPSMEPESGGGSTS